MMGGQDQPSEESARRPIALLVNVLSSGGAQRRIATLANRFVELGRAVDLVTVYGGGPMAAMLAPAVGLVTLAPPGKTPQRSMLAYMDALAAYLAAAQPAVLMSCVNDTHRLAVAARKDVPLVLRASRHPHRTLPWWQLGKRLTEPSKQRRMAACYASADAIVALSESSAAALQYKNAGRLVPVETIYNPVVATTLVDAPESRLPAGPVPLIVGVGRLVEQKDFATLLRAFALVRRARPAQLAILGEGGGRRRLVALARRLGLAHDVEFPGEVDDVAAWLLRADLFVSSSLWEGVQGALVEALAAGCPVVATDCPGGARDVLLGGALGALVPVRDPHSMASAIIEQLTAAPPAVMLAAGASRFTVMGKAEQYLRMFDALVTKNEVR